MARNKQITSPKRLITISLGGEYIQLMVLMHMRRRGPFYEYG